MSTFFCLFFGLFCVKCLFLNIQKYQNKTMTVKINKKKIELKYTLRSLMMYENMTGGSFNPTTITDTVTYMYCVITASAKDYELKFDDFIDWLDENPTAISEFGNWVQSVTDVNETVKKN